MKHRIALVPGDGIGPEITDATLLVLDATGVAIEWARVDVGEAALARGLPVLPPEALEAVRAAGVALKGPVGTPVGGGHRSVNVSLRQALDLYACVRPVRNIPGVNSRFQGVDLVIVRENTEGLYSGLEHMVTPGVTVSLKVVTEKACDRIARFACELARKQGRQRLTAVHKANIMKLTDGLFLECTRRARAAVPELAYDELIIDNCAQQLVLRPERFGVLVMDNLYGDIMSDLAAGLVGGLGVAPGANQGDAAAVFEPVHGTAPDIAGKGWANPTAMILSAAMMLEHLNEPDAARRVRAAVDRVLGQGIAATRDLGGSASTLEYARAVAQRVRDPTGPP